MRVANQQRPWTGRPPADFSMSLSYGEADSTGTATSPLRGLSPLTARTGLLLSMLTSVYCGNCTDHEGKSEIRGVPQQQQQQY